MTSRLLRLLLGALTCAPLAAQSWVTNGDFNAGLAGWTPTGYWYNPTVETHDTAGTGASPCFGCSPGTPPLSFPLPSTLDQPVLLVPTVTWELSFAVSCTAQTGAVTRNDAVTVSADVNGNEVATMTFDAAVAPFPQDWHARVCGRFTVTASGLLPLSIKLLRPLPATPTSPRVRIDDVSLQIVQGPSCNVDGSRRIGRPLPLRTEGTPGALYAAFCAAQPLAVGFQLPGVQGLWFLDPASMVTLASGTLDAGGKAVVSLVIPNDPRLVLAPIWFQAAESASGSLRIGFHHGMAFTN